VATTDMRRKRGLLCCFRGGDQGPRLTQCGLGRGLLPYQMASSFIQPFDRNRHGPKTGGAGSPSNAKSPGPRPTSILSGILVHPAVWPQRTLAENWRLCPFREGGAGSPSNTMSPRLRPTSVPSDILIHKAVWPQYTWADFFFGGGLCLFLPGLSCSIERIRGFTTMRYINLCFTYLFPYLLTKWHLDASSRLATIEVGRKLGLCTVLGEREAGSPSSTMLPTCMPSAILIHPAV